MIAPKKENIEAEIVIIGGGGAGLAAALAASEKGCKNIVVLEKAGSAAGSTVMAHDIFGAESPVQKRQGVDAPKDDLFKVAMEWAHWTRINPRLVRAFIDKSGDTIGWLEKKGLSFELIQFYPNQVPLVRHSVIGHGTALMKCLRNNCLEAGVKIFTRSPAKKILRDSQGKVTGVVAESKEGELRVTAKSVIVASGGYGNNKEMLRKYCPCYHENMTYDGPAGNTGDGIIMATEIGAATDGLGAMNLHGPFLAPESPADTLAIDTKGFDGRQLRISLWLLAWEPETIWMNKNGRRFVDEGYNLSFFSYGNAVALQPDGVCYTLLDSKTLRTMEEQGFIRPGAANRAVWLPVTASTPMPGLEREVKKQADRGVLKISNSWDEIAKWMGAKPATLKATIEEYNTACDQHHDGLFAKDPRYLLPLRVPPYYTIKGHVAICDAYGGIKVNENMEALDIQDNPIPGLYAAGSTAGCVESEKYCERLTGHLVGWAINSGRIAGENAVAYLAQK